MRNYLIIVLLLSCAYRNNAYSMEDDPICFRNQTSCSYMFGRQFPLDFCKKIIYDANETAFCKAAYKENDSINRNTYLGKLTLFPFYGGIRTNFNVTFTDIQFKLLRIYFQGLYTSLEQPNCMVKEFIWNGIVPSDKSFSYTCPWTSGYEGNEVEFHYDYGVEQYETRKKFIFKVPHNHDLYKRTKVDFFPYIDHTDLGNLTLHIHPASDEFNINKYKIDFIYSYNNQETIKSTVNLTAVNNSHNFYTSVPGDYYFRIEPVSDYCYTNKNACVIQETPKIRIEPVSSILIGMVGVSLLIPIFMIIVYMWTKHWPGLLRKKCETNVLLVTVPTNDAHMIVAPAFADFLRETFNINVMLDINELPKDSFDWLKTAIHSKATHIMYLRSDDELSSNKVIYQDIYRETIALLKPKLNPKEIKQCIISFSYSSDTTEFSHPALVHLIKKRNFNFDKKLRKITKFLINKKVSRSVYNNPTYRTLRDAIQNVVEQSSERRNQKNNDVILHIPVPEEDYCYSNEKCENVNEKPVKNDLDLSEFGLLGEQYEQISNNEEESSDDSDIDGCDFYGNA